VQLQRKFEAEKEWRETLEQEPLPSKSRTSRIVIYARHIDWLYLTIGFRENTTIMSEVSVAPANGFGRNTIMFALVLLRYTVAVDVYFDIAKQPSPVTLAIAFHLEHSHSSHSSKPSI
jgi:hypothetical protein